MGKSPENGQSQWIGNFENLRHAHRMRAICDGVMVGKMTRDKDQPRLTVRHVEGRDPVKLFLEGNSLSENEYKRWCFVRREDETHCLNWNSIDQLLVDLYEIGIKSIYLEGGGKTISYFLENGLVDHLQVHIAPIILGSGKEAFHLSEVESIAAGLRFKDLKTFTLEDEVMLTGSLEY